VGTIDVDSYGGGVRALALTPQGDFGDLPNSGKASKRDLRPWLKSVLIAGYIVWYPQAAVPPKPKQKNSLHIGSYHYIFY